MHGVDARLRRGRGRFVHALPGRDRRYRRLAVNTLPAAYAWLGREPGPRTILEALSLFGTKEVVGGSNRPASGADL